MTDLIGARYFRSLRPDLVKIQQVAIPSRLAVCDHAPADRFAMLDSLFLSHIQNE